MPNLSDDLYNDILKIFSIFPIFITLMLLLISLINTSIFSSFISYFIGLLILTGLWKLIGALLPPKDTAPPSESDDATEITKKPETDKCMQLTLIKDITPLDFGLSYLIFTFLYIFIPMIIYKVYNVGLIIFLALITILDVIVKKQHNCCTFRTIFISCLLGFVWSSVYIMIVYNMFSGDNTSAEGAFFITNLNSDKATCSRTKEQQFKCAVYKNGELLKTI
tara:strand:+ start:213 stop:878 length:666 start_codon:yes stop_codon:yes gene_type:complete